MRLFGKHFERLHELIRSLPVLLSAEPLPPPTRSPAGPGAMELVMRNPDPGRRRERYIIVDDVWLRAWRADTGAHAKIADAAQRGTEIFGADTPSGTRLAKMGQFFGWLSGQMSASSLTDATAHDALTVLAALVYAARPLTVDELAVSLDWPHKRVSDALDAIEHRPSIADPLAVASTGPADTYTVATRPDRLSTAQRQALRHGTASRRRPCDSGEPTLTTSSESNT